jgi:hypothetical protein
MHTTGCSKVWDITFIQQIRGRFTGNSFQNMCDVYRSASLDGRWSLPWLILFGYFLKKASGVYCLCLKVLVALVPLIFNFISKLISVIETRWFHFPWGHWIFQFTYSFQLHYSPEVDSSSNRNEYQLFSGGQRAAGLPARKADDLTAFCEPVV